MTNLDAIDQKHTYLYRQVISLVRQMHLNGTIQAGEKLPSLRSLATKLSISVPTVKQAYIELEQQGLIYAREKSGYYLKSSSLESSVPKKARLPIKPTQVTRQQLIEQVYKGIHQSGHLPLGVANPVAALPASKALNRTMRRTMSLAGDKALNYGPMNGFEPLRRQLAIRYLDFGMQISPEEIVITNGAQEALNIALQSVAKRGDIIAVESPCYFGILELIENLGMLALEIPLSAETGLTVCDVEKAIDRHMVKACVFSSTVANPLGCLLADTTKKSIVELLESKNIPLIEDDVYGDLYFNDKRGIPAQHFSRIGLVLTCSSFSKTVAPSYRVGWVLSSTYNNHAKRIKRAMSCSSSLMNQWTLYEFIRAGEYDRYVKQLRQVLQTNKERMVSLVRQYFPGSVRVTDPKGGTVLWIELAKHVDGNKVFQEALSQGISVAPGTLFSPSNRYQHCIRLSYGLPWSDRVEKGIKTLSEIYRKESLKKNN
ncbi:MAG: DNA-binding transcriptional MocR family regulator [Paraglaciecola sp.]|jgi:DNA-binding transcriptional MocR family regulator